MKDFTFVMLTYNQEQYVVEHLESIKYQIEHFGQNIKINFILADDASKDKTVYKVKKWIESNKDLFCSIKFLLPKYNKGIVSNFISALRNIKTEHYKILAGDDLYFKNDIFKIFSTGNDIYFTPVIRFTGMNVSDNRSRWFFKEAISFQNKGYNMQKFIADSLQYTMNLETPGIFLKKSLVNNNIYDDLNKFQYIEDVPFINSLLKTNNLKVFIEAMPYILYRVQSGISTNKNHSKYKLFIEENEIVRNEIFVKQRKNKYLNWFKYEYEIKDFLYKYNITRRNNEVIQNFRINMLKEESLAIEYLKLINKKAKQWEMIKYNI